MSYDALLKNATAYALVFGAADVTSSDMQTAIPKWFELYFQNEATKEEDPCQRIPYTVVRKLTSAVFSEYSAGTKDAFADSILAALGKKNTEAMQMALIGGESLLKPIPGKNGFNFGVVPRYNVLVFGRDSDGRMTDIGTMEQSAAGVFYYTLLERRQVDDRGYLTIRNRLFRSYSQENLGQEVPLNSLPKYADLPDEYTFGEPVDSIGLVSLRTPMVNCVDGTIDAVSVYAAAVGLIRNINRNEAQINGEFERGKLRITVSADMFKKDHNGRPVLEDDVFVGLDDDQETIGISAFSPALRDQSFLARKQEYLRNVENIIGLKRGLLSEVEAAERTATEITSSAGEYNLTIIDFQKMWDAAVKEVLQVCGILGRLYRIPNAHDITEDQVTISWGNGVLFDEEKTRQRMLSEVSAGLLQPERYLGFTYKLPCDTEAERAKIRKDYMPEAPEDPVEDE